MTCSENTYTGHMQRIRNVKRWKVNSYDYETPDQFLSEPRMAGAHAIQYNGQMLDLLVQDRGSACTLVVFSGALNLKAKYTPAFSGLSLAEDTGVNLVAVADPSMDKGDITVAWYLGNSQTGPLRTILSSLIRHVVDSLGGSRTILFGGSGGGYAATHLAHDFPDSIAFVFNPRLSLERWSEKAIRQYFKNCHNRNNAGQLTAEDRHLLAPYGPTEISALSAGPLNHHLLIYHNLLDPQFLDLQLFPFLDATPEDSRLKLQLSLDELGHTAIPADQARNILSKLAQNLDIEAAISSAGFLPRQDAIKGALRTYPSVAFRMQDREKAFDQLQLSLNETEQLRNTAVLEAKGAIAQQLALQERAETAEILQQSLKADNARLKAGNEHLTAQIETLKNPPSLRRRVLGHPKSRELAKFIPERLKNFLLRRLL